MSSNVVFQFTHKEEFIVKSLSVFNYLKRHRTKNWSLLTVERNTSIVGGCEKNAKLSELTTDSNSPYKGAGLLT